MSDDWRYQFPSTTIQWKFKGDEASAMRFMGEANKLLYQVKNQMKFQKLNDFRAVRFFNDGTTITARSLFGQDFIEINAPLVSALKPSCSITLFNVPEMIPPMKWYLDGIHEGEAEGIDYIKTYYSYSTSDCPTCSALDFTICETDELAKTYGWTAPQLCKPFVFKDKYIPEGMTIPSKESDPTNHCIYGSCQAEIIKFGSDDQGSYFLWKAYTEWSTLGPTIANFTRNGLGYLLLRAFINLEGTELCTSDSNIVKVDCCLKDLAKRPVIMFWEKCDLGWQLCPVPEVNTIDDLMYFWSYGGWNIMSLWTKAPTSQQFGCLPYEWLLTGRGQLTVYNDTSLAVYKISTTNLLEGNCHEPIIIDVKDRCGTSDSIFFKSCCDDAEAVGIGYTSLLMACNESQTFTASGCPPYSWSLSGLGTLVPSEDTHSALYTAPATNPGCNNVITLTDCCGNSAQLKLAVNCYTGNDIAYYIMDIPLYPSPQNCGTCSPYCGVSRGCNAYDGKWGCVCSYLKKRLNYKCNAVYISAANIETIYQKCTTVGAGCPGNCSGWPGDKVIGCCSDSFESGYCGLVVDVRTQALIDAGCCPINPETGLPF